MTVMVDADRKLSPKSRFTQSVLVLVRTWALYVVADVVLGVSRNCDTAIAVGRSSALTISRLNDCLPAITAPWLMLVEPRIMFISMSIRVLFEETFKVISTNTSDEVDRGVMLTEKPVTSTNEVLVVLNESFLVVLATCRMRKAPRRSFISAAVRTLPATNVAGRLVGVVMPISPSQ